MEQELAPYSLRVWAKLIDVFVFAIVDFLWTFMTGPSQNGFLQRAGENVFKVYLVYCFIYAPLLDCIGGTIGKSIVGIKAIGERSHKNPNFIQTLFRSNVFSIAIFVLIFTPSQIFSATLSDPETIIAATILAIILYVPLFWKNGNQIWKDYFSSIVVIKSRK